MLDERYARFTNGGGSQSSEHPGGHHGIRERGDCCAEARQHDCTRGHFASLHRARFHLAGRCFVGRGNALRVGMLSGTLKVAISSFGSEHFDPRMDTTGSNVIWGEIFEMLIGADANGNMDNLVWLKAGIGPDGKSVTFHLYNGVQWHDGVELTADHVQDSVDSHDKATGTTSPAGAFVSNTIKSVTVVDKYTVTMNLSGPGGVEYPGLRAGRGSDVDRAEARPRVQGLAGDGDRADWHWRVQV